MGKKLGKHTKLWSLFSPFSPLFKYLAAGGGQEAGEGGGRAHRGQRQPAGRQARAIQVGKCRLYSLKSLGLLWQATASRGGVFGPK